jgi:hypothetical protein
MMGRLVRIDRRYKNPYRLTLRAWAWTAGIVAWLYLATQVAAIGALGVVAGAGYGGVRIWRGRQRRQIQAAPVPVALARPLRFNPPPGWPAPAIGWTPPPGWQPDPTWPPAPAGWQLWVPDEIAPIGERNSRAIPQAVKVAVAARDGGRCRQCGSAEDIHFDHVIPYSRGGANTVANIQLLCGRCNRAKGARESW